MKRTWLLLILITTFCAALITGCAKGADPEEVVATVNGENITRGELTERLEKIAGQQILDQMITEKLIMVEGEKKKATPSDEEIDAELKSTIERFGGQEQFKAFLERRGESEEEAKERIVLQLTVQALVADKVKVTDEQIKSEFETNKDTIYAGKTLDQAKADIKKQLEEQQAAQLIPTYIQELKDKAKIDNKLAPSTTTTTAKKSQSVPTIPEDSKSDEKSSSTTAPTSANATEDHKE